MHLPSFVLSFLNCEDETGDCRYVISDVINKSSYVFVCERDDGQGQSSWLTQSNCKYKVLQICSTLL